ncbi:hypothetical protein A2773_06320 [Candidatus Gottesmanbacteria bacterium RIFCSPHIGHO2_01_FULL_39_10]|uniref:Uncharacterized protein n=1 Tax=Candidatus Gottesmanbacteria bacterium RIFCSPHIGHO2_01_FULL_39_10 TaxID=1798375 RepID=A0A1F5ZP11_9BACT|nr:MAG: hypothetical protein A2773_06320 [Candidatus Gottesmanbacteria bacterium RIFCSPHIGHO2_01_FULL_39_10]
MINLVLKYKKFFILIFTLIVIIILALIFRSTKDESVVPEPGVTVYPSTGSPSPYITGVSTTGSQTGFDEEAEKKYREENPDLVVEADLRVSVPIKENGFTVDFSYPKDKFLVFIDPPYTENYAKFQNWFKNRGLQDQSHFEIINK